MSGLTSLEIQSYYFFISFLRTPFYNIFHLLTQSFTGKSDICAIGKQKASLSKILKNCHRNLFGRSGSYFLGIARKNSVMQFYWFRFWLCGPTTVRNAKPASNFSSKSFKTTGLCTFRWWFFHLQFLLNT